MSKPIPLQYGQTYHVYNRGINRETIFVADHNYRHFLRLYAHHVAPIADTYAYCLLPNHFHFLVHINAHDRTGSLFQRPFGRIPVADDTYFAWLVAYIHRNPQKHGLLDDFRGWPYSSYHACLSTQPTGVDRDEVLAWFDGQAGFRAFHRQAVPERQIALLVAEDFD